jgi:hypothetical protein
MLIIMMPWNDEKVMVVPVRVKAVERRAGVVWNISGKICPTARKLRQTESTRTE